MARLVLRGALPQPKRDLHPVGGDPERHDVRVVLQDDPVEHQHSQAHIIERATHQLRERLGRARHESARDRALGGGAGLSLDLLPDRLLGAHKAPGRDTREHPLQHRARERVAAREVLVGGQPHLHIAVLGAHPRALDRHPPRAERDLAVI